MENELPLIYKSELMNSKAFARAASILTLGALLASPGAAFAHNGVDHSAGATHEVASPDSGDSKKAKKSERKKARKTKSKKGSNKQSKAKKTNKAKSSKGKRK